MKCPICGKEMITMPVQTECKEGKCSLEIKEVCVSCGYIN